METINYLCLDNEQDESLTGSLRRIERSYPSLKIIPELPNAYDSQVDALIERISSQELKGVILDLRLDDIPGDVAHYRGPTIAQELRTRSTEQNAGLIACPLILWSTDPKLEDSFRRDDTSHDLFDYKIFKDRLAEPEGEGKRYATEVAKKMVSLVDGYRLIRQAQGNGYGRAIELLNIDADWSKRLDVRIFAPLWDDNIEKPIHDQARYIRYELLETPNNGIISTAISAARLGIDSAYYESAQIESLINNLFPDARYLGPFHEGWPSWWAAKIVEGWSKLPNCPGPLLRLSAEQRVNFINQLLGSNDFEPSPRLAYTTSTKFSTICRVTGKPIDPVDGFMTARNVQPWQLTEYVSLFGMLNKGEKHKHVKIDPLEQERFDEEKKAYTGNISL